MTQDDLKTIETESRDLDALFRYRDRVTSDPLRLHILAAHSLIEELIELVIADAVPNSECFDVPNMRFSQKLKIVRALCGPRADGLWKCIEKLTSLRNAAAHKDYESLRDQRFSDLAEFFYPDPAYRTARSRDMLLEESTSLCAGVLTGMLRGFPEFREKK